MRHARRPFSVALQAAMLVAAALSHQAFAQLYMMPYAVETVEAGTPPNVVSAGGYMAPGGRVFGPVMGLYDKSYADFATLYLIQMAAASNGCYRADYDRAVDNWKILVRQAYARLNPLQSKWDQALHSPGHEPGTPAPAESAAYLQAKWDADALSQFPLPPYDDRHCVQPPGVAPPAPPTPPPPPQPPARPQAALPNCRTPEVEAEIAQLGEDIYQIQRWVDADAASALELTSRMNELGPLAKRFGPDSPAGQEYSQLLLTRAGYSHAYDSDRQFLAMKKARLAALEALPPCPAPAPKQTGMVIPVPNGVFVAVHTGPAFSSTGKVSNFDLGNDARAGFGTGFQIGGEVGVPVADGVNVGIEGVYTGGLSPAFTNGMETATGSAHAETFLVHTTILPLQLSPSSIQLASALAAVSPMGLVQPYIDVGLGASVDTMGQLTGHSFGMPTGTGPGETKVNLAWQAGAGLRFDTGIPGLSASVGYDYLHLGNFSTTSTFNLFSGPSVMRPPFNVNVNESVIKAQLIIQLRPEIVRP
jgi:hypothetical protein